VNTQRWLFDRAAGLTAVMMSYSAASEYAGTRDFTKIS
jgi:hypothetical protein